MTDGWWRIKQHAPNAPSGFLVTEIPVVWASVVAATHDDDGVNVWPSWEERPHGLVFYYQDHREYFPWASIVHAEYQPPTKDTP